MCRGVQTLALFYIMGLNQRCSNDAFKENEDPMLEICKIARVVELRFPEAGSYNAASHLPCIQ